MGLFSTPNIGIVFWRLDLTFIFDYLCYLHFTFPIFFRSWDSNLHLVFRMTSLVGRRRTVEKGHRITPKDSQFSEFFFAFQAWSPTFLCFIASELAGLGAFLAATENADLFCHFFFTQPANNYFFFTQPANNQQVTSKWPANLFCFLVSLFSSLKHLDLGREGKGSNQATN